MYMLDHLKSESSSFAITVLQQCESSVLALLSGSKGLDPDLIATFSLCLVGNTSFFPPAAMAV